MSSIKSVSIIGAGWLGKDIAIYLQELGYDVIGSRTSIEGVIELKECRIKGIVFDALESNKLPDELKKDIIIITLPPSSAKDGNYSSIIKKILEEVGNRPSKVIFTSSTGVYLQESGIYDESSPKAASARAKNILDAEKVIFDSSISSCIIRLGGLAGIDRHPGNRSPSLDLVVNEPVNLVFKDDILSAISFILDNNLSGIFNIVAPMHPNRGDYYNSIYKKLNIDKVLSKSIEHPLTRVISSKKIQNQGFKFKFEDPLEFPIEKFTS